VGFISWSVPQWVECSSVGLFDTSQSIFVRLSQFLDHSDRIVPLDSKHTPFEFFQLSCKLLLTILSMLLMRTPQTMCLSSPSVLSRRSFASLFRSMGRRLLTSATFLSPDLPSASFLASSRANDFTAARLIGFSQAMTATVGLASPFSTQRKTRPVR